MIRKNKKKAIKDLEEIWMELGLKSFARFYGLSMDEVIKMAENPNGVFFEMLGEMSSSLNNYENFMVKVRRMEDKGEELTRADILDL